MPDAPLIAEHPEIPAELALQGFDAVRAYAANPEPKPRAARGEARIRADATTAGRCAASGAAAATLTTSRRPSRGIQGAGSVHHVAWACTTEEQPAWRERLLRARARTVTPQIDRFYFKSLYFREPSGVLFELATMGPGFAVDEDPAHLGERLSLPPAFEHLREQVEPR